MKRLICTLLLLTVCASAWAAEPAKPQDQKVRNARLLFESYVRLEHAFDSKVADLYSDQAIIRNKRTYPDGRVRNLEIPAAQYKSLMRGTMPLARLRKDFSTYTEVTYEVEGDGVRIKAKRYSEMKKYSSPISILVKPSAGGAWRIVEELSESRP